MDHKGTEFQTREHNTKWEGIGTQINTTTHHNGTTKWITRELHCTQENTTQNEKVKGPKLTQHAIMEQLNGSQGNSTQHKRTQHKMGR